MKCDLHADTNHTHTYGKYMLEYLSQCTICVCNGEIEHAPLVYVISMKTIKPLNHGQEDKRSQCKTGERKINNTQLQRGEKRISTK